MIALGVLGIILILATCVFVFTDGDALVEPSTPPGAKEANAARMAVNQLRGRTLGGAQPIKLRLTSEQLSAVGTLASYGLKPDRLLIELDGSQINIVGSHRLFFGRWINAGLVSKGSKKGFPKVHLTVGSVSFSSGLSRRLLNGGRLILNWRGARIPPLDTLVQSAEFKEGEAFATVQLPLKSGIIDQISDSPLGVDAQHIVNTYCRIASLQAHEPTSDLAETVRRAFPAESAALATTSSNRAAFVALAMFTVSPNIGEFAGLSAASIEHCASAPVALKLNGRFDLAKHWSLSAALEVTAGAKIGQAMGEWKELSDTVYKQSEYAMDVPSGFSFVDLAADRSGLLTARAASDAVRARSMAAKLSTIEQHEILPASLMNLEEGMSDQVFVATYGTIKDPRFISRIQQIDEELARSIEH